MCRAAGAYGAVPGYGGHAGDAFGGPGQQYRSMNYPANYPPSSGTMELHQAGQFVGPGGSGPGPGTSAVSGADPSGMQSANVDRAGSTTSEDQSSAARPAQPSDSVGVNAQQASTDSGKDSNNTPTVDGNHLRLAGQPSVDDNLGRPGMDIRPGYPTSADGMSSRYGQLGMDVRGIPHKQMFVQMPSRSTPFMNMNGVAIRPGQLQFAPDSGQGRSVEGMVTGLQSNEMDSMSTRSDQPFGGQDVMLRRPVQPMPADAMFVRQGPPPFGMDGPGGRLGPPSGMDQMMRRTGHPVPDDGTMNRSSQNAANVDTRTSMHSMPARSDEACDDGFRQGPHVGPGSMSNRPGMDNMSGRPLPQMGGMVEGMNARAMQPQHPVAQGSIDMMPGRPGPMRMDAVERRGGMPEGIGLHSQHPGYGQQYPGYGSHPTPNHPGHGQPPSGFSAPDSNASGDQMFRNHMPPYGMHPDGRGPAAPVSGGESYRPGTEISGEQRHFMANGEVDTMRRTGDPSFGPKNFENGKKSADRVHLPQNILNRLPQNKSLMPSFS